jgi:hypothetical protein
MVRHTTYYGTRQSVMTTSFSLLNWLIHRVYEDMIWLEQPSQATESKKLLPTKNLYWSLTILLSFFDQGLDTPRHPKSLSINDARTKSKILENNEQERTKRKSKQRNQNSVDNKFGTLF